MAACYIACVLMHSPTQRSASADGCLRAFFLRYFRKKTWRMLHGRVEFRLQHRGAIAQLGERLHGMQEVGGSIPPGSTTSPDTGRPIEAKIRFNASPSSRGLGHHPFTVATGVRIPVGTPLIRRTPRPGMPGLFVHRLLRLRCGCPKGFHKREQADTLGGSRYNVGP